MHVPHFTHFPIDRVQQLWPQPPSWPHQQHHTAETAPVLYWMSREQRLEDNWSLLWAKKIAEQLKVPLYICYILDREMLHRCQDRHYSFILENILHIISQCESLGLPFIFEQGPTSTHLIELSLKLKISTLVMDYSPLKEILNCQKVVTDDYYRRKCSIDVFVVDSHNLVPPWITTDRFEPRALTIRKKLFNQINKFLTEFPPLTSCSTIYNDQSVTTKSKQNVKSIFEAIDPSKTISWAKPGHKSAMNTLQDFLKDKMPDYLSDKLDPTKNCVSNISPWLHFGHISTQRAVIQSLEYGETSTITEHCSIFNKTSLNLFLDQLILCKEMAENFCHYCKNYEDPHDSAPSWALKTLQEHAGDPRQYIYSLQELEEARTHDPLWNAAQLQMVNEAKMHGFMRLYWSKKFLEWTESLKDAAEYAIQLNDKYSLDGSDPNGYKGIMWSLVGLNDRPFGEREVYGKIRYMCFEGCRRKFKIEKYIKRIPK